MANPLPRTFNDYNKLTGYKNISYNIISFLMDYNEDIWKVLKYESPDALYKPELTRAEKGALIYNGQEDSSPYRVFRDEFPTDDAFEDRVSQLRIFPVTTSPIDRNYSVQDIVIEFITHVKINHLEDYLTRIDFVAEEIIKTLNGQDVGFMSPLSFDATPSSGRRTNVIQRRNMGNNKNFTGVAIIMSCKVG